MTDPALRHGDRIGHFTIMDRLGAGGMGEVYRAHDERLRRKVALKVLPSDAAAEPTARARLLREARSAAALNHPHVCTIHEVGEADGRDFIAMELVEGQALDEVLRQQRMAVSVATRIGIEVADALSHAHERGVVHRDLKSPNVMRMPDGRVKVLDFGLARSIATADGRTALAASQSLTEAGTIVGTTHYLSPEVLSGAEADARSDLWALGVLLHEMVAGEMPFAGQTRFEVAAAILHSPARPLPEGVPPGLRAVITHCLEKEPARRYQRASEVRAALEAVESGGLVAVPTSPSPVPAVAARRPARRVPVGLILGGLLGVVLVGVAVVNRDVLVQRLRGSRGAEPIRSLAILPLENLSRDPAQAYFADGMTEEISSRLAKISALRVIAQGSVTGLVQKQKSLADIGRALRVPALLRGSVVTDSLRVRISMQLVWAATGELLWAESYDRSQRDVLSLQSEVALAIAHQIQVTLTPQEKTRLAAAGSVDPEAYRAYLRGRAVWGKYTLEGFQEAERQFRHAIEIAPDYAPAWAGLADAAYGMSSIYVAANDVMPKSRAAAQKALALDPNLAEAYTSYGIVKLVYDWDWDGAERAFDRAIELRPGDANAHLWRGQILSCRGRFDEGLVSIRRALDLDPLSSWVSANLGFGLYKARRYKEALTHLRGAVAAEPGYFVHHVFLGIALEQQGDHAGAIWELETAVAMDTNNDDLCQLAHAYGTAGRRRDFERVMKQVLARREHGFMPAANIAMAYAGMGERDAAFHWLDLALEDHSEMLTWLKVDPAFDPLRSDPRFDQVLRRIRLLD